MLHRAFITILLLSLSLGCSGEDSSGPDEQTLVGTWNLQSVDGVALPWPNGGAFLTAETLQATLNGRFRLTTTWSNVSSPYLNDGDWTLAGNSVTLDFDQSTPSQGILNGNTLTVQDLAGEVSVYRRN